MHYFNNKSKIALTSKIISSILVTRSCMIWLNCGFSNWLWQNQTLKNRLWFMTHFSDVILITSPKNVTKSRYKIFPFGPPQSKFLATALRSHDILSGAQPELC